MEEFIGVGESSLSTPKGTFLLRISPRIRNLSSSVSKSLCEPLVLFYSICLLQFVSWPMENRGFVYYCVYSNFPGTFTCTPDKLGGDYDPILLPATSSRPYGSCPYPPRTTCTSLFFLAISLAYWLFPEISYVRFNSRLLCVYWCCREDFRDGWDGRSFCELPKWMFVGPFLYYLICSLI